MCRSGLRRSWWMVLRTEWEPPTLRAVLVGLPRALLGRLLHGLLPLRDECGRQVVVVVASSDKKRFRLIQNFARDARKPAGCTKDCATVIQQVALVERISKIASFFLPLRAVASLRHLDFSAETTASTAARQISWASSIWRLGLFDRLHRSLSLQSRRSCFLGGVPLVVGVRQVGTPVSRIS